jgi:hypothetical protein
MLYLPGHPITTLLLRYHAVLFSYFTYDYTPVQALWSIFTCPDYPAVIQAVEIQPQQ